jgi:hypothetical protein
VGARTDAARAEVLSARAAVAAARSDVETEIGRLEAAGRSAVDIPSKVRRAPAKTAGVAAGAVFLLAGGPGRVVRRVRRAVMGPEADMPRSMLPDEVEKTLRRMGSDGEKVRGTLEREFAAYLEEHREERESRNLGAVTAAILASVAKPVTSQAGKRLAQQLFSPDNTSFRDAVQRVRERREGGKGTKSQD